MSINAGLSRLLPGGRPNEASEEEVDRAASLLADAAAAEDQDASDDAQDPEDEEEEMEGEDAQDDEEDQDEEEAEASEESAQAARAAERARIAGILRNKAAKGRESQALVLALDTDLSVKQAEKLLQSTPKGSARGSLSERMESERSPTIGLGAAGNEGGADSVDAASQQLLQHVQPKKAEAN